MLHTPTGNTHKVNAMIRKYMTNKPWKSTTPPRNKMIWMSGPCKCHYSVGGKHSSWQEQFRNCFGGTRRKKNSNQQAVNEDLGFNVVMHHLPHVNHEQGPDTLSRQAFLCLTSTVFFVSFHFVPPNPICIILLLYQKTEEWHWSEWQFISGITWNESHKLIFVKTKITLLNNFPFSVTIQYKTICVTATYRLNFPHRSCIDCENMWDGHLRCKKWLKWQGCKQNQKTSRFLPDSCQ